MHNGSTVSFTEESGNLEIDYEKPRPGLLPVGVREGTMLFYGSRNEDVIEGKAYIFNARCGPLRYEVRGTISDTDKVAVLSGLAPRVNAKCDQVGEFVDSLRFERLR
jgi:hypothetical protein